MWPGRGGGRPYRPYLPLPCALQESLLPWVGADVPAQRLASPRPLLRPPHPSFLPLSSLSFHHLFLSFAFHSSPSPNHRFIKILFKTLYYFPSFQLPPASFPRHIFPGHVFTPISALSSHLFVRKAVDASVWCLLGSDLRLPGPPLIRPDSNEILPVIPTTDLRAAFDWRPHATDGGMKKRSSCNLIGGGMLAAI